MNPLKAVEMYSDFSKIYKRPSPTIRFVHNLPPFSILIRITTDQATKDDP